MTANELGLRISRILAEQPSNMVAKYLVTNNIPYSKKLNNSFVKRMGKQESRVLSESFVESVYEMLDRENITY